VDFLNRVKAPAAFMFILAPRPGTKVQSQLLQEGRIFDHDWRHYTGFQVVYHPKHMTARQLEEGYWRANRKYYSPLSMLKRFHRAPYAFNMLIFNLYFAWAVRRRFQPLNYFF
jgi:hypothetical protein